jgi:hypothetical protein
MVDENFQHSTALRLAGIARTAHEDYVSSSHSMAACICLTRQFMMVGAAKASPIHHPSLRPHESPCLDSLSMLGQVPLSAASAWSRLA